MPCSWAAEEEPHSRCASSTTRTASSRWTSPTWRAPANAVDIAVLGRRARRGPVLDIGCGPGRTVRGRRGTHSPAPGIDVSAHAAALAGAGGTPVLRRSVFDRLPLEGLWAAALLMDGNIGIGGDPAAPSLRAQLIAQDGRIVVEVDPDPDLLTRRCTRRWHMAVGKALRSWARVGSAALVGYSRLLIGLGSSRTRGQQGSAASSSRDQNTPDALTDERSVQPRVSLTRASRRPRSSRTKHDGRDRHSRECPEEDQRFAA